VTETNLRIGLGFDVVADCADGYTGLAIVDPCVSNGEYVLSGCAAVDAGSQTTAPAPSPAVCDADFNESGSVNVEDLLILLGGFGGTDASLDITQDGNVNVEDLLDLLAAFGRQTTACFQAPQSSPDRPLVSESDLAETRTCYAEGQLSFHSFFDTPIPDYGLIDQAIGVCMMCCEQTFPAASPDDICAAYAYLAPPDEDACAACHGNCAADPAQDPMCDLQCEITCNRVLPCDACHMTCDLTVGADPFAPAEDIEACHCGCDGNECLPANNPIARLSSDCGVCHLECDSHTDLSCLTDATVVPCVADPAGDACLSCHSACDVGPSEVPTKHLCGAYCTEHAPGDAHCLLACNGFNENIVNAPDVGTMNEACHGICMGESSICHAGCDFGPRCMGSDDMGGCNSCIDACFAAKAQADASTPPSAFSECVGDCGSGVCGWQACRVCNEFCLGTQPPADPAAGR
jgi:hypothetical protein